jgi:5-methylcytosine-specific restriction endonuclease McrA
MMHRKLYRELGYGSIQQYAAMELGFSPSKTSQFLRLSEGLERLPRLKQAMVRGELGWTKAREIEKVATAKTEQDWIAEARRTSRRELEAKVRTVRKHAKAQRKANPAQMGLAPATADRPSVEPAKIPAEARVESPRKMPDETHCEIPGEIRLALDPEQLARYETLMERLQKQGHRADRANLVLAGLEALLREGVDESPQTGSARTGNAKVGEAGPAQAGQDEDAEFTRVNSRSSYQVLVQQCPRCEQGLVHTTRGDQRVHPTKLAAILCDADVREKGKRMRAVVPPRLRREILARDGHRCRSAGCRNAHLLEVHHRVRNGSNEPSNLITLCSSCHRAIHQMERARAAPRTTRRSR